MSLALRHLVTVIFNQSRLNGEPPCDATYRLLKVFLMLRCNFLVDFQHSLESFVEVLND